MPEDKYVDVEDFFRPRPKSYGLWMYKQQKFINRLNGVVNYSEACAGYEADIEIDTKWKVARAFSCIGIIVAGFILLWQFAAPFLLFDAVYWKWAMGIFCFIGICQGITLTFVGSMACHDNPMLERDPTVPDPSIYPEQCSWDWGTKMSIAGTILYFLTVVSMFFIAAPGTRPNERKLPMMVWGDDGDDDDASAYIIDEDDYSVDSFACDDYDYEDELAKKQRMEDENVRERRPYSAGYGDFDMEVSVSTGKKSEESSERVEV